MTDNDNTTSDTVIDSAKSGTLPGALSASAVTEALNAPGNIWSKPAEDGGATAEHETRIQRIEDEIAFLRKMFGWPEKA